MTREEFEKDLLERVILLNEKRPVIENLKNLDKHKMMLDSVLIDRLKLDGEVTNEEEHELAKEVVKEHKVVKEGGDPGCFILPIRLEGKLTYNSLVDTGSNINMMPYRIYALLERGKASPKIDKVKLLDHSSAETMGRLLNVLCQIGTNTILANFLLFDVPIDRDVPLVVGRSFMYTLGTIMDMRNDRISVYGGITKLCP